MSDAKPVQPKDAKRKRLNLRVSGGSDFDMPGAHEGNPGRISEPSRIKDTSKAKPRDRGIEVPAGQGPQAFLITGAPPAPAKPARIVEMTSPLSVIIAPYSAHKAKTLKGRLMVAEPKPSRRIDVTDQHSGESVQIVGFGIPPKAKRKSRPKPK